MRFYSAPRSLFLFLVIGLTSTCLGEQSADPLLRLVPADAGVTLAAEDLRIHIREFFDSSLYEGLLRLPSAQRWFASDLYRHLDQARQHFEKRLGVNAATLRDALFGDAVVLTFSVPANGHPEEARGLLLLRVTDRNLLDRFIQGVNESQIKKGELGRVADRKYRDVAYFAREYAPQHIQPSDFYVTFDDNTFAWANSEELIQGVIDRKGKTGTGLGDDPGVKRIREKLPKAAVLSLFVNPRLFEQILTSKSKDVKPEDEKISSLFTRYISAVAYAGAALELRGGLVLHTQEEINPGKIGAWLQRWGKTAVKTPTLHQVPSKALAYASIQIDFLAVEEVLNGLIPDVKRSQYENGLVALKGVLLGREVKDILASVGPRVSACVTAITSSQLKLATVARVELHGNESVAAALENALRTLLAIRAVDRKPKEGPAHLETEAEGALSVLALVPSTPFAFSVNRDQLLLARSARSILAQGKTDTQENEEFDAIRASYFPEIESFFWIDVSAVKRFGEEHRDELAKKISEKEHKPVEEASSDLTRVFTFIGLFRSAFVTSEMTEDGQSLHRTLGLIAHESPSPKASALPRAASAIAKP